uniref:Uncharacterized protein n=1 Tax=Nelumbo nucifera TaxID=4432 RepID=A0A822YWH7_NELNU|nr:TPA_asm: hypothetical protein HUJ06_012429 [Nelumbo nucifera]
MPENGVNYASQHPIFRPKTWSPRHFPILTGTIFLGILIIWSIDGYTITDSVRFWRNQEDYLALRPQAAVNKTQNHENPTLLSSHIPPVDLSHNISLDQSAMVGQQNATAIPGKPLLMSLTQSPAPLGIRWISAELEPNFTSNLLSRWSASGRETCQDSQTVGIRIPGLDDRNSAVELSAGEIHEFVIQALDESGKPRCVGGDYFETDLSGELWKSRPPVRDLGSHRPDSPTTGRYVEFQ